MSNNNNTNAKNNKHTSKENPTKKPKIPSIITSKTNHYINKFQTRLKSINDHTSDESIQTLTNWLLFNRHKYSTSFMHKLYVTLLEDDTKKRKVVLLKLLHEVLTYHNHPMDEDEDDEEKKHRADIYREIVNKQENVDALLEIMKKLKQQLHSSDDLDQEKGNELLLQKVKGMVDVWEEMDLFDDTISLYQLKKILDREIDFDMGDEGGGAHRIILGDATNTATKGSNDTPTAISDNATDMEEEVDDNDKMEVEKEIGQEKKALVDKKKRKHIPNKDNSDEITNTKKDTIESTKKAESAVESSSPPPSAAIVAEPMEIEGKRDTTNIHESSSLHPTNATIALEEEEEEEKAKVEEVSSTTALPENYTTTTTAPKEGKEEQTQPPIIAESNTPKLEVKTEPAIDFTKMSNVPYKPIPPTTFYESCKSITVLQIPREIQMDSARNTSQLLQTIPPEISNYANALRSSSPLDVLSSTSTKIPDLSVLSDDLLDIPIHETTKEVQILSNSIQTQYEARIQLLQQLYTCKCLFGSQTAAKEYYNIQEMLVMIQQKKEMLEDAMELEGVDVDDIKQGIGGAKRKAGDGWKDLEDLDWYSKEQVLDQVVLKEKEVEEATVAAT